MRSIHITPIIWVPSQCPHQLVHGVCSTALPAESGDTLTNFVHVQVALDHCHYWVVALAEHSIGKGWKTDQMQQCACDLLKRCNRFVSASLQVQQCCKLQPG